MLSLTAKVHERQLGAYLKKLDNNRGKPLMKRAERKIQSAAVQAVVPSVKAEAPRRKRGRSKGLRRDVKATRVRGGGTRVGSTASHANVVVTGTKPHSLGSDGFVAFGRDQVRPRGAVFHPGAKANPFVARGVDRSLDTVRRLVGRDVFDET